MTDNPKRRIGVALSMPRLCFTDNMLCMSTFVQMGATICRIGGAYWEQAITRAFLKLVEMGHDYIITVDYDSLFDASQVAKLIDLMEKSGADAIFPMQVKRNGNNLMWTPLPGEILDKNAELSRALSGHFGMTIIRTASLAKIPQPWFWSIPSQDAGNEGSWDAGSGKRDADTAFWQLANVSGWKCYQANRIRIGHMETSVVWPGDNGPIRKTMDDFDIEGVPVECQPDVLPSLRIAG